MQSTEKIESRALRSYASAAEAVIAARAMKRSITEDIDRLIRIRDANQQTLREAEERLGIIMPIIYGEGGPEGETFAELFRRFEMMIGCGAEKAAREFGLTSSATLFWKTGAGLPKSGTWDSVAAVIEKKTEGLINAGYVISTLSADRSARKQETAAEGNDGVAEDLPGLSEAEADAPSEEIEKSTL